MNDEHTPGFYRIELNRTKRAYDDMRRALLNAEKLNETAPEKMVVPLEQVQNEHLFVSLDYIIANNNFQNSLQKVHVLEKYKRQIGFWERCKSFFKTK